MLTAEKGNKVYTIDATQKDGYVALGYDVYDEKGKLVAAGAGNPISSDEYAKIVAENEKLKAEIKKLKAKAPKGE